MLGIIVQMFCLADTTGNWVQRPQPAEFESRINNWSTEMFLKIFQNENVRIKLCSELLKKLK